MDLLGFDVRVGADGDNVYLSSGTDNLALHRASPAGAEPAGQPSRLELDHLGLMRSIRRGRGPRSGRAFWRAAVSSSRRWPRTHRDGARSFYFKDPDGNGIQIIHHTRESARSFEDSSALGFDLPHHGCAYILCAYSLTIRRAQKREKRSGVDSLTIARASGAAHLAAVVES